MVDKQAATILRGAGRQRPAGTPARHLERSLAGMAAAARVAPHVQGSLGVDLHLVAVIGADPVDRVGFDGERRSEVRRHDDFCRLGTGGRPSPLIL